MGVPAGMDAWLLPAVLALLVLGPGFWVLYRLVRRHEPLRLRTEATIERLTPHFPKGSPLKTQHVLVAYSFVVGPNRHGGECVLPVQRFAPSIIPPGPVIIYDVRVNMPVLISDETRVVGEEAIEHQLLGAGNRLRVVYSPQDPANNEPADTELPRPEAMRSPADQG